MLVAFAAAGGCGGGPAPSRAEAVEAVEHRLRPADIPPRVLHHPAEGDDGQWIDPTEVAAGSDVLVLLAAECYDNGEGERCPHGPFGSVYLDLFPPDEPHWPDGSSAGGAEHRCYARPDRPDTCRRRLRGPHIDIVGCPFGLPARGEWVDGDVVHYAWNDARDIGPGVFVWPEGQDHVVMRLWESDPGARLGRGHDVLGIELVDRALTSRPGGVWIAFHAYSGDRLGRRPTERVTFRLRLRTLRR